MIYKISHRITVFAEEDMDFDLFKQESFRIASEMNLECEFFNATPASLPSVIVEGASEKDLKTFYKRLMPFFY